MREAFALVKRSQFEDILTVLVAGGAAVLFGQSLTRGGNTSADILRRCQGFLHPPPPTRGSNDVREGGSTMKLPRRNFLHLAAGAAALPAGSAHRWAPTRP